jgi:sortase (surface protein transpeptidase)
MKKKKLYKVMSRVYLSVGILLIFVAFLSLSVSFYPSIWYTINKDASDIDKDIISEVIEKAETELDEKVTRALPRFDNQLPKQNTIKISLIGVDSKIIEDANAHRGLTKGIWIVPDFGRPDANEIPIIIAAHRFGYTSWTREFRHTSSFYNLPKLNVGDRVQIIWDQRSYEYEVYKAEDNTQITDYSADLILYTCRMYNSPIRVFRYLERAN